jgi:hypothetical protein
MSTDPFIIQSAQDLIDKRRTELEEMGYLNSEGNPISAGIHLIPLLKETLIIVTKHIHLCGAAMNEQDNQETETDESSEGESSMGLAQNLNAIIQKTISNLQEDGFDQPDTLAFELIIPHMNWLFCLHYSYCGALGHAFDIIERYEHAFDENHEDQLIGTVSAFLEFAKEKNATWSAKIAEKGLKRVT